MNINVNAKANADANANILVSFRRKISSTFKRNNKKIPLRRTIFGIVRILIVLALLYFIVDPFLPEIQYRIRKLFNIPYKTEEYEVQEKKEGIENKNKDEINEQNEEPDNEQVGNRLIIESIGVDVAIVEGNSDKVLSLGAWRRPKTSTPDKGGNTVITGHRYQYFPPSNKTFYNLDKLNAGDEIKVIWNGVEYLYTVSDTKVVEPDQIEIEENTKEPILTLYTCHPLFTAKNRFVVISKLQAE